MIQISLRQLEYFLAAAQYGGAARAAEALHISQPSVSKAIADLETMWGETLFVRHHAKGMELTAAGLARLRETQALVEQARRLQAPRNDKMIGVLRLGYLTTLGPRWIPCILQQMSKCYPGIDIELVDGDAESLARLLERGQLDAALQYDLGLARPKLMHTPIARLTPYALLPAKHVLASKTMVSVKELSQFPLILISLPHSREYFLSLFRDAAVEPLIAHETESFEMIRSLVANEFGVSILTTRPLLDKSYDGKRLACRRLRGPIARQTVVLTFPKTYKSTFAEPLITIAQAVFSTEKTL